MTMKLVIVESPYAGAVQQNVHYARLCLAEPIASHLLYTQPNVLNDDIPEERALGIAAGLAWRSVAEKAIFYVDRGWSSGMTAALELYDREGFPYEFRKLEGY
ncbi:putative purine transdeoxyribosylase [Kosakonia virus Kc318]|uniref:Purine transdeoxyribosylase n=1 Tax=Kosakonia virus Kc318 TaxID=2797327 RepID=A0AAE7P3E9_9CAUD|nr:putative purine transdeoxyribosylase [Kosakonia virus Kc318]